MRYAFQKMEEKQIKSNKKHATTEDERPAGTLLALTTTEHAMSLLLLPFAPMSPRAAQHINTLVLVIG